MPFAPGASGNPKGRPPKTRALTEILQKAGNGRSRVGDKRKSRKNLLADMLWAAVMTGEVLLTPEYGPPRLIALTGGDWFDAVKFLYNQIDGPPKVGLFDVPEDTAVSINFVKVEGRKPTTPEAVADTPEA